MRRLSTTLLALALCCIATDAWAVPATISFTGRLSTTNGPVSGNVGMTFTLFAQATGGNSVWTETRPSVPAMAGLVYAELGALTTLDETVITDGPLFLQITVGGETLMPRLPLQSVPYAIRAEVANSADTLGTIEPGDVITGITAGAGVTVNRSGNTATISATNAGLQSRVTGTCGPNASIASINADGTVACETDTDTDTNTTYTAAAGSGVALGGTAFGLTTCSAGQVLKAGAAAGTWACAADVDTNTTYSAGSGVTLNGTTFATDNAVVARKDSAAGNQAFDGNTLFLDYTGNRVGIGTTTPVELLEVSGPVKLDGLRLFRKDGNNGGATCKAFCEGSNWGGGTGQCLGSKYNATYLGCDVAPGAGATQLTCMCLGFQ